MLQLKVIPFRFSAAAGQYVKWRTLSIRQATGRHEHQISTVTVDPAFLKEWTVRNMATHRFSRMDWSEHNADVRCLLQMFDCFLEGPQGPAPSTFQTPAKVWSRVQSFKAKNPWHTTLQKWFRSWRSCAQRRSTHPVAHVCALENCEHQAPSDVCRWTCSLAPLLHPCPLAVESAALASPLCTVCYQKSKPLSHSPPQYLMPLVAWLQHVACDQKDAAGHQWQQTLDTRFRYPSTSTTPCRWGQFEIVVAEASGLGMKENPSARVMSGRNPPAGAASNRPVDFYPQAKWLSLLEAKYAFLGLLHEEQAFVTFALKKRLLQISHRVQSRAVTLLTKIWVRWWSVWSCGAGLAVPSAKMSESWKPTIIHRAFAVLRSLELLVFFFLSRAGIARPVCAPVPLCVISPPPLPSRSLSWLLWPLAVARHLWDKTMMSQNLRSKHCEAIP